MAVIGSRILLRVQEVFRRDRWIIALIVALAVTRIMLVFFSWSPNLGFDADAYMVSAHRLVTGTTFYHSAGTLTYPWLIAFLTTTFNSIYAVIVFQYILSIFAAIALYFALKPYTRLGAIFAAGLVAFDPQLGYLQNIVSSDGFYGSMQILAFCAFVFHMPPRPKPSLKWSLFLGMFLGFAYLTRTVGTLGIVPAALVYMLALRSWRRTALLGAGYVGAMLLLAGWLLFHSGHFSIDYRLDRLGGQIAASADTNTATSDPATTTVVENLASYWITPQRIRYFANFFVFSGHYISNNRFHEISDPVWAFHELPTIPGLGQLFSWLTFAWDTISSSLWLLCGALMILWAPRATLKWPILFGILLFLYHATATVLFNKVIARYVTVVSFYREVMFAFLLVFAVEGFLGWRQTQRTAVQISLENGMLQDSEREPGAQ